LPQYFASIPIGLFLIPLMSFFPDKARLSTSIRLLLPFIKENAEIGKVIINKGGTATEIIDNDNVAPRLKEAFLKALV